MNRLLNAALAGAIVISAAACGGNIVVLPTQSGTQQSQAPGTTPGPAITPGAPQPGGGDNQSKARSLVPPGSTEMSSSAAGDSYSIVVSTTQTVEALGAFWQSAIPAAGMTESGRFNLGGTLTIALTNPDGGIVAIPDPSQGITIVTISVGQSS